MANFATCEDGGTGSWWGRNIGRIGLMVGSAIILGAFGLAAIYPDTFE